MTTIEITRYDTRMPWPDRTDTEVRLSGQDWLLRLGNLLVWGDLDAAIALQGKLTAALIDAGYETDCATPETLAKRGGVA